ncbi:POK19 protein, partial [Grantiella picta]|nr:POK19 protein [Grantiella picta]
APVRMANLPDIYQQAKLSHSLFHQNVPGLMQMFDLTKNQAKAIVATCPNCQPLQLPSLETGVNPCG